MKGCFYAIANMLIKLSCGVYLIIGLRFTLGLCMNITCFTLIIICTELQIYILCLCCVLSLWTLNLTFNLKTTNIAVVFAPPPGTNSMTSLLMFHL